MYGGVEGKILKATLLSNFQTGRMKFLERKKQKMYKELGIRMALNYLSAVLKARRQWSSAFIMYKKEDFQPRILYTVKPSVKCEDYRYIFGNTRSQNIDLGYIFLRNLP